MNGLKKRFWKSDPKHRKISKNQSEIAACKQKTTKDKMIMSLEWYFFICSCEQSLTFDIQGSENKKKNHSKLYRLPNLNYLPYLKK